MTKYLLKKCAPAARPLTNNTVFVVQNTVIKNTALSILQVIYIDILSIIYFRQKWSLFFILRCFTTYFLTKNTNFSSRPDPVATQKSKNQSRPRKKFRSRSMIGRDPKNFLGRDLEIFRKIYQNIQTHPRPRP